MISDEWEAYRRRVIPADAPPVQIQESQRSFWAGAWACFATIESFLGEGDEPTSREIALVEEMFEEMRDYVRRIGSPEEGKKAEVM